MHNRISRGVIGTLLAIISIFVGQGYAQAATGTQVKAGGSLTIGVIASDWFPFVPASYSNGTGTNNYLSAVFGQLFTQGSNGEMEPSIATGYKFVDNGRAVDVFIRKGVKFSDGIPVTAEVAAWNMRHDLTPSVGCTCDPCFTPVASESTAGKYTMVIHLKAPNPTIIQCFEGHGPNNLMPPSVFEAEGMTKFGLHPVGAGPYMLTLNQPDSKLVFTKNPHYWEKGYPLLKQITFLDLAQDQPAYAALQSGQVQMVLGVSTPSIVQEAQQAGYAVQTLPANSMGVLQLNTLVPPFNNLKAREAVQYAIDPAPILNAVAPKEGSVAEGMQGPAGLFFEKNVSTYRSYNSKEATALVKEVGGLSMTIQGGNTASAITEEGAIAEQLRAAGIKVTLQPEELTAELVAFSKANWQAIVGCAGGSDPDVGACAYPERFGSHAEYSGLADATLNRLIQAQLDTLSSARRQSLETKIDERMDQEAYAVPLFGQNTYILASKSINATNIGPGGGGPTGVVLQLERMSYK